MKKKKKKINGGGGSACDGGWEMLSLEQALEGKGMCQAPPSVKQLECILHKCSKGRNLAQALRLQVYMRESGMEAHRLLGNYLVSMLVDAGSMCNAQQVFDTLAFRSKCSWNSLITGYMKRGESRHALILYEKMQKDFQHPSGCTIVALLKACAKLKDVERGHQLHAEIARNGLLGRDLGVGNGLLDMYAKCGLLLQAQEVFKKLPVRDVVSWTILIAGYVKHGHSEEALSCFKQMQLQGVSPSAFTFTYILKACASIGAIDKGIEIHSEIAKEGLLERNLVVGSTLVDMYAKFGLLSKAHEVFDNLPVRDVVLWTALITGYSKQKRGEEALNCFEQMQHEGISPNAFTFACSLKACGSIGATEKGRELHAEIARTGLLEKDLVVGNALVDMYAKCGLLTQAQEVFNKLPVRDVISWTALITGYTQHGRGEEALNCFKQMRHQSVPPTAFTFACSLKACAGIGAIDEGQEIHAEMARQGLLERDHVVGSALVDMYASCGLLAIAQEVFDKLPILDVVSWNALIAGYAQLGQSEHVFHIFERMREENKRPNNVTFLSVLNACSHAGLVDKSQTYFEAMSRDYGITPTLEHYTCMIDLLGRAGQLDKAVAMIKKMPFHPDLVVWLTVLGACRKWGNVELGSQAFEHAARMDEKDAAAYVCMYNVYADADMQEDANKVESMRVEKQAWKNPGQCWWTDASGIVHSFWVGDKEHFQNKHIYAKLEELSLEMREEGYVSDLHWVSQEMSENANKDVFCGHSEKLAIACALINTPKGTPIHVVKNLWLCKDCHLATALISKIEQRIIRVRDARHLHVFKEGKCDCKEYDEYNEQYLCDMRAS